MKELKKKKVKKEAWFEVDGSWNSKRMGEGRINEQKNYMTDTARAYCCQRSCSLCFFNFIW